MGAPVLQHAALQVAQRLTSGGALTPAGEAALLRALHLLTCGRGTAIQAFSLGAPYARGATGLRAVGGKDGAGPGKPNHSAWLAVRVVCSCAKGLESK
jgi:hypothetical protein